MCKTFNSMSNFQKFIWLFSNENANVLRGLLSLYMTVIVRDWNYYEESEYLELTISSWRVPCIVCSRDAWVLQNSTRGSPGLGCPGSAT